MVVHSRSVSRVDFGIFDHLDRNGLPLATYNEERLRMTEA